MVKNTSLVMKTLLQSDYRDHELFRFLLSQFLFQQYSCHLQRFVVNYYNVTHKYSITKASQIANHVQSARLKCIYYYTI